ncbi:MAG TPA: pyridoxal 5'-phosphate synthase glutaminase subunit PdxT [Fimbriimonadaceae bacterium]|nr:pyridoxal 5'-phosphate synthase glutaminase subunit PdxT [Fimbriimonadaceae bacterium]
MGERVGVVAIQGDFEKHLDALRRSGLPESAIFEVRTPEDLAQVDRAILPGGESTTVGLLMQRYGLGEALQQAAAKGMPIWGTCMGMILMAKSVFGRPDQYTLNLLDIEVERNAFGAQVHSFEAEVAVKGLEEPVTGVFIRAPVVVQRGSNVEVLAEYEGKIVAVIEGRRLGTSFHPELTDDIRLHQRFLAL